MQDEREELHFRRIDMRGYRRTDGLFEVEGRVTDRRSHEFAPGGFGEMVPAHRAVHRVGGAGKCETGLAAPKAAPT